MPMSGTVVTYAAGAAMVVESRMASTAAAPAAPLPNTSLWVEMPVAVGNKDLEGLAISLRPGVKMTGTVQFNGSAERPTPPQMQSISLVLEPADPKPGVPNGSGRVEQNGTFSTVGMVPGRYFVRMRGAFPGWTFQSAMVGGRDASIVPVDIDANDLNGVVISFTDKPGELSGQVSGDGQLEGATVIVFPADQTAWTGYGTTSRRLLATRADKQGKFTMQAPPAGDYIAVAMPDKMANDWQNPKFLQAVSSQGERVHVSDGSKAALTLKVIR